MSSSENDFQHVPRSRDGAPNWAADTDPVGPVTPELALVDPALAGGGQFNSEVTMSSMQFGDGTTLGSPEASTVPTEPQPFAPLQPIPPLNQISSSPEVAPPVPAETTPAVPVTDMRDVPLGTLVFRAGLLPEERLEEALHEGMKTGRRLGEILLERGWVSENDLGRLLAAQKGLPFVELDASAIDPTAPPLLHPEKARLHGALPVGFQDGVPVVAVADPSNDLVVENVRRALACEPVLVVAGRDALARTIEQAYGAGLEAAAASEVAPPAAEAATPAAEPVEAAAPTAEAPAAPVEPSTPVVEPVAQAAEPVAAQPEVPPVEPVAAQPEVQPVEPLAVEAATEEPVAPLAVEPVTPVEPVPPLAVEQTAQPVDPEVVQNGHGLWVGETAPELASEPVQEQEQVQQVEAVQPLASATPLTPPVEPEPVAEAPTVEPETTAEAESGLTWSVVLRLSDGERIEVGSYAGEAEAVEGAHGVVAQLATGDSWPFFAGRFLRPETIVSVDLVQENADRWLGSSARAAAWTQKPAG